MADLPGLIEGASQGVGLGTQFPASHRADVLSCMFWICPLVKVRDPYDDYVAINNELETYNLRLMERPQIIVANKMDMPEAKEHLQEFKKN